MIDGGATKRFIRKESLPELGCDDITIIDSDNDVWAFMCGEWISQMNNAWPASPKLPVWVIEDEAPRLNPAGTYICGNTPEEDYTPCTLLAPHNGPHYSERSNQAWE